MKRILAAVLWVPLACDATGMALQGSAATPQPATVLTAIPTADAPATAPEGYRLILKDGRQYTTREPYRVKGKAAVFVLFPGQLVVSVPLQSVDQQATRAANAPRPTPTVTPMAPEKPRPPTLGEFAAQVKLVTPRPARIKITLVGTPSGNEASSGANDYGIPGPFSGRGHNVTSLFTLGPGLYVFSVRHSGESNFIIHLMDQAGHRIDSLVNQIGNFSGSKALRIEQAGQYLLNIDADGEWAVSVARPDSRSAAQAYAAPPLPTPAAASDLQVQDIDAKVTETNDIWSRFSWKLTVKNWGTEAVTFDASIEFLDRSGFVLDEDKLYNARVPASQQQTFTGYQLINAEKVGRVQDVQAKVKQKRR